MIDWEKEKPLIEAEAAVWKVDPLFIQTIRHCENGGPGREFGVLSESAPTYHDQLKVCCETVAHRIAAYALNPMIRTASGRLRYSPTWIAHFAQIWAPRGAENDPKGLNSNWLKNALKYYDAVLPA